MDLDKLTDLNFKRICQSKSQSMYCLRFVDFNGNELSKNKREQLAMYMEENGLIKRDGENCILDYKSKSICETGWLEHLNGKNKTNETFDSEFSNDIVQILENLKAGKPFLLTKSASNEASELIIGLKNLGILNNPKQFFYSVDLNNRKYISKLMELKSLTLFLDWFDNQTQQNSYVNDFSGSTIGSVIQSNIKNSSIENNVNVPLKDTPKSWFKKFFSNPWIIGVGLLIIEEFVFGFLRQFLF